VQELIALSIWRLALGGSECRIQRMQPSSIDVDAYALRSATLAPDLAALRVAQQHAIPWYRHFLAKWMPADRAAPIVDAPCGMGNLLAYLAAAGYTNVRGIDLDAGQVGVAKSLGHPAEVGDAFAAVEQAPEGSLAVVFAVDFLEHVDREAALRFCRAARRALRTGGMLLCRTPCADGPFASHDRYNDMTHKWGMSAGAVGQLMLLAGFDGHHIEVTGEPPVPYKWQNAIRRALYEVTVRTAKVWLDLSGIGAPRIWTRSMWIASKKS
jgi:2-polyprenyl-3-methyl-5-hydroxy-6-metoxy-1,4-benzoquinol methylase